MKMRPEKIEYYIGIARSVARRSPCTRRKYGAILVKNDSILASGYNGSVRGTINCGIECKCLKDTHKEKSLESYNFCPAVHAEVNAVLNAARNGVSVLGATLYLTELDGKGDRPCRWCRRVIINSGIKDCYHLAKSGKVVYETIEEWIELENAWIENQADFV